jgi:hypothetical protein
MCIFRNWIRHATIILALSCISACPAPESEKPKPESKVVKSVPAKPAAKKDPAAKAPDAAANAAAGNDETASHPDCVGPMTEDPKESFTLGEMKLERAGAVLNITTSDPDDEFRMGQITDVKDFTPENMANIKVALGWFAKEKVDAIAVTGDIGESAEGIEKVLTEVAKSGKLVFAIAGNRECRSHFSTALAAVQKTHKNVINMNKVRVVNADDASIVSLPGYYNRSYIHCPEGCSYNEADVKALATFAAKTTGPVRVLLSHGPPKMSGDKGLDRIHEEVNVGDPNLTEYLKTSGSFPFGCFGNIQEAGGYATDLSGENRIAQNAYADKLYMNPGPIDAVRWSMLDGTESLGMAGLLHIKGKQAKHKIYRIRAGEAKAVKAE